MKATPGPWKISFTGDGKAGLINSGLVASVNMDDIDEDEGMANVHLILAAPDLLEALEKIHSAGLAAHGYKDSPLGKQVQSAINKANGL